MVSETDGSAGDGAIVSFARSLVNGRTLVMLAVGVVTGVSISVLGMETVTIPFVGSVPGTVVGVLGIAVALAVYQQTGCCDDCGESKCGCTDECGDRCSYDP